MAEPLERQVVLDISPALGSIRELDDAFESFFAGLEQRFQAALAPPDVEPIDVDVAVNDEEAAADIAALGGEPVELTADLDASDAEGTIAGLDEQPLELTAEIDTTGAEADIDELSGTEVTAELAINTGDAEEQLSEVGAGAEGAAGGVNILGGAVAGLTQKFTAASSSSGATGGAIAAIGPAGLAAAGGTAIAVGGLAKLVSIGTDVLEVTGQFQDTFGSFSDEVRNINVAGLNTSLEDLSISLGTDDEALLAATSRAGAFATTLGLGQAEVAKFGENVVALGAFVSSVNPSLGDIDQVVGQIARTLSRSPQGLGRLGLDVDPERIKEVAASLGKLPEELSRGELAAIAAQVAVEGIGDASDEVAKRQDNAGVATRAFKEQITDLVEEIAVPVAIPIIEALQDFAPVLRSLAPVARIFGEALGLAVRGAVIQVSQLAQVIGAVVAGIGDFINEANGIPFVGKLIGDDLGDKVKDFGVQLEDASIQAREAAVAGADAAGGIGETGDAAAGATGDLNEFTDGTFGAAGGLDALSDAAKQLVTTAVGQLPTAAAALNDFNSGIEDAFGNLASAQEAAASANEDAANAVTAARDKVRDAQASAGDDAAKTARDNADKIAKATEDGNEKIAAAANVSSEALSEARKAAREELDKAQEEAGKATADQAEAAAQRVAEATAGVAEANAGVVAAQQQGTADIAAAQEELNRAADPQVLIDRLKTQALEVAAFTTNLKTLLALGLTDTVQFLAEQGPQVGGALAASLVNDQALAQQTEAGLDALDSSTQTFERFMTEEAAPRIEAAVVGAFRFDITQVRTEGQTIGAQFAAGIAAGLTSAEASKAVENSSRLAVRNAKEAAEDESGSHSPSRVFALIGADMVAGMALGLSDTAPVEIAAAQLATAAIPTLDVAAATAAVTPIPTTPAATPITAAGLEGTGRGVIVQGPLIGEVNENADPLHISTELAWALANA